MSGKFQPIEIPPGVVSKPTKNMRSSNWAEVNLVRWIEGELQPVGGQQQMPYNFATRCKRIHGWFDLQDVYHIAYVCQQNVYVDTGGVLAEITPLGGWPAPPLPGQGGYGDLNYGEDLPLDAPLTGYGDPRPVSEIPAFEAMPPVWSVDNFGQILYVMSSADGRLLKWDPSLPAGIVHTDTSYSSWGTSGSTISMENVNPGSVLPGMQVNNTTTGLAVGILQSWPTTSGVLTLTTNALSGSQTANDTLQFGNLAVVQPPAAGRGPVPNGRLFVVTPERFIMIFGSINDGTVGSGSFRRFSWCDQENPGAWDYGSVTSMAGFLDIEPSSPIVTADSGRYGTLFFTSKKAYVSRFVGLPYVYNYTELADDCTPYSPASITTTSSSMAWMSAQGMFNFDGTTITPVNCPIRTWITDDIDQVFVRTEACLVSVGQFNELWWCYPQYGQQTNTRIAVSNFKEGWWSQAQMSRSAGVTSSYTVQPTFADGLIAFLHEIPLPQQGTAGGVYINARLPWAETFDINLTSGTRLVTLKQVLPDIKGSGTANLQWSFFAKNTRSLGGAGIWTPPVLVANVDPVLVPPGSVNGRGDGYIDARLTGRNMRMRLEVIGPNILPWTVGEHLFDWAVRGDR